METASATSSPIVAGRQVHYAINDGPHAGQCRPATIITRHDLTRTDIAVTVNFLVEDLQKRTHENREAVMFDANGRPGTWHWPKGCPNGA